MREIRVGDRVKDKESGRTGEVVGEEAGVFTVDFGLIGRWLYMGTASLELIQKPKRKSTLIEVDYQELPDGMVRVTEIRNLLTPQQLRAKYGDRVIDAYMSSEENMGRPISPRHTLFVKGDLDITDPLPVTMSKDRFDKTIAYMKKAGENLCRIAREHRKKVETKTITI